MEVGSREWAISVKNPTMFSVCFAWKTLEIELKKKLLNALLWRREGKYKVSPLLKELLTVASCCEREVQLFLRV